MSQLLHSTNLHSHTLSFHPVFCNPPLLRVRDARIIPNFCAIPELNHALKSPERFTCTHIHTHTHTQHPHREMNFVIPSRGPEMYIFKASQVFLNAIYFWKIIAYLTVRQVMQQQYQSESESESCSVGSDCL